MLDKQLNIRRLLQAAEVWPWQRHFVSVTPGRNVSNGESKRSFVLDFLPVHFRTFAFSVEHRVVETCRPMYTFNLYFHLVTYDIALAGEKH